MMVRTIISSILLMSVCMLGLTGIAFAEVDTGTQQQILDLKHQIIDLQNEGTLGAKNVTFCSEVVGPGMYTPLPSDVVADDVFYVYYEPENPYTKREGGRYLIHLTQDLYILDLEGNVLMGKENVLQFAYNTAIPVLDLYITNTITLTDAPAGTYVWKAVLHDQLREESIELTKKFIIE